MRATDTRSTRSGVAAPIALAVLIALALLSALFIEASLADRRAGRAALGAVRASAVAETALERGLAYRLDSAAASGPVGAVLLHAQIGGVDSVETTIRRLQPGLMEVRVRVSTRSGGFRVVVGRVAHVRLRPDSLAPYGLALQPLPGHWWVATP